jgi:c-di-AMP phosphodiesterase-like protein
VENERTLEAIIDLIKVDNLQNINDQLEISIYSFITQVIREESDYKRIIGKRLLPILNERLYNIQDHPLVGPCELKFFKMLSVLTKNCKENIYIVKSMKEGLTKYSMQRNGEIRIKNKIVSIVKMVEEFDE